MIYNFDIDIPERIASEQMHESLLAKEQLSDTIIREIQVAMHNLTGHKLNVTFKGIKHED